MTTQTISRIQKYKNVDLGQFEVPREKGCDIVEVKYDGWWCFCQVKDGVAHLYTRTGTLKMVKTTSMPDCVVIGEFLYGTARSENNVDGRKGDLLIFDCLSVGIQDVSSRPLRERKQVILDVAEEMGDWISVAPEFRIGQAEEVWEQFVEEGGAEGLVFKKSSDESYETTMIFRMKQRETMDYVVMGFTEGMNKNKEKTDTLGALIGGLYVNGELVRKVAIGGGFYQAERKVIWENQSDYIGKVIEVIGYQVFDGGSMRHPNVTRNGEGQLNWREDKNPKECTWSK